MSTVPPNDPAGCPSIIPIEDADDPRIEPFRHIRERDLTRAGRFIAEGTVVLDQILASATFRPVALLLLRSRVENLLPRIAALPRDVPVYVVASAVFDAIAGFPVHRGVMALVEAGGTAREAAVERAVEAALLASGCVVVACGISNHDNMGAIFRNAAGLGAHAVLVDPQCCDPLYRKAIRVSVGAVLTVPFARCESAEAVAERLARRGFECLALSPAGRDALKDIHDRRPRALFLGSEGSGLEASVMKRCRTVRIEMAPAFDSLNVATSAAIVLHHCLAPGRS